MRLNKFLSEAGAASRREADKLITQGRVSVNDRVVTELGTDVNPARDAVTVDNKEVRPAKKVYIAFHKPPKVITTMKEQFDRPSVADYVKKMGHRVFPVGRLDYATEGLLLMTNDGELAHRLMHPRFEIDKTYTARIKGRLTRDRLRALREGVVLDGVRTAPAQVKVLDENGPYSIVRVIIHEGRNRQVRRMMEAVSCEVEYLRRDAEGSVKLGELPMGRWRHLTASEVAYLRKAAGLSGDE